MADATPTPTPTVRSLKLYPGLAPPWPIEVETAGPGQLPHVEIVTAADLDAPVSIAGQDTTVRAYLGEVARAGTAAWNAALQGLEADHQAALATVQGQLAQAEGQLADARQGAQQLTTQLAAARATIRAGLLDYDSAQCDLRQATAEANGYLDWADVRATAQADGGPHKAEAAALVAHDNVVYAQSAVDAQAAGATPAAWRRGMTPWVYDDAPGKAAPAPAPTPAPTPTPAPQEG